MILPFALSGILLGLPYGLIMDSFVGFRAGIFDYGGLENSTWFLLMNALLSYGIAIGTAFNYTSVLARMPRIHRKHSYLYLILASSTLFLHSRMSGTTPLIDMFLLGAVILFISDFALVASHGRAVLIAPFSVPRAFGVLLGFCILTGVVYEATNYIVSLWTWKNDLPSAEINLILVVLLGYFVLMLPMIVLASVFSFLLSNFKR